MNEEKPKRVAGYKRPPGRPKGSVNKHTGEIKEMIRAALDEAGGVDYLVACAKDPKTTSSFLALVGKILPMQLTGKDGGEIQIATRLVIKGE